MQPHVHWLVEELVTWFRSNARPLPWRVNHPGPWGILVVEVMSQQTPIPRVQPIWQNWMERWPTPGALAQATPAEVIRAWGRLGYPRRALHLHQTATRIVDDHEGAVPDSLEALLALPGVGEYTAAAVLAFGFGKHATVLDTNIRRVLTRTLDGVMLPTAHLRRWEVQRASELLPEDGALAVEWNAAVMEFGALVCQARSPACHVCPVTTCRWRNQGYPDNAPTRPTQAWQGTDRQIRGQVMAQLRDSTHPIEAHALAHSIKQTFPWVTQQRLDAIMFGLVKDSLVEQHHHDDHLTYCLPQ